MITTKNYIIIVIALALSTMIQSCSSNITETISLSKNKLETKLATSGELIIDNIIESYREIQNQAFESEYNSAIAGILAETQDYYEPSNPINDTIRKKIEILFLYKQALNEYAVLADEGFSGKQASFTNSCKAIITGYGELGDSVAIATSNSIGNYLKASRYDENTVVEKLIDALNVIWQQDVKVWTSQLNDSFSNYKESLANISDDAFDQDKLIKQIDQPINNKHALVEIYKIMLIKERRDQINTLVDKQDNITSSILYLNQALKEFQKKSCDKDAVKNNINRIQLLLNGSNEEQ